MIFGEFGRAGSWFWSCKSLNRGRFGFSMISDPLFSVLSEVSCCWLIGCGRLGCCGRSVGPV